MALEPGSARKKPPEQSLSRGPVGVKPEPRGGLRQDVSLLVVARGHLDVDAAAPPLAVDVLDLCVGIEYAALGVDREAELAGAAVAPGVGAAPPPPGPRELTPTDQAVPPPAADLIRCSALRAAA